MIITQFLHWIESSDTKSRVSAVRSLCEAYVEGQFFDEEMRAAEGAMALLLEDRSPAVRKAMALALSTSENVPLMVINALAQDQVEVSAPILAYSPILTDNSLVDLIAKSEFGHQFIIAKREFLSASVCAALIEIGDREAIIALLENSGAQVAQVSVSRLSERFGHCGRIRSMLLERKDLPSNIRHKLVEDLGNAFAKSPLLSGLMGQERASSMTKDACLHATLTLADTVDGEDLDALVEHLRIAGKITPAFLVHTLCVGNIDFFATAIAKLSGKSLMRVRSILSDGHYSVVKALYISAGLEADFCPVFVDATLMWRDASRSSHGFAEGDITRQLIEKYAVEFDSQSMIAELLMMLENIQFTQSRKAAKQYALSLTNKAA